MLKVHLKSLENEALVNEGMIFSHAEALKTLQSKSLRTRIFDFHTSIQQCRK